MLFRSVAAVKNVLDSRTGNAVREVIEKINPKNNLSKNINKVISGDSKDIIRSAVVKDVGGIKLKQAVGKMIPEDKGKMKINKPYQHAGSLKANEAMGAYTYKGKKKNQVITKASLKAHEIRSDNSNLKRT